MPEEKKGLPLEVQSFLKLIQENISLYPETIVYNRIKDYIPEMTTRQVAWLTSTIITTTDFRARIFKKRCDTGDDLACDMLELAVNGDPYSKNQYVKKGLMGLFLQNHDIEAGELLVELGKLSRGDFDQQIKSSKAGKQELIGGKTHEEALCELVEEAKEYKSGDEFSMAMIMGKLKKVPEPNTANVKKIIQGKYKSGEEFWNGVQRGDLTELCKRVKEEKEIVESAKRETIIRPEVAIPPRPVTSIELMPMEEVRRIVKPVNKEDIDIEKRLEELRKKKELEKQKEKERQEKEKGKPPSPQIIPAPTPPAILSKLDLMKDDIEKHIAAEIKRRKTMTEGQAGEPVAGYGIKKKDLSRATLLEVTDINPKLLDRKEIAHLSKDIEDKCIPLGYINMYSLYPKSRFGTDTAILYDCRNTNTDSSKLKRDIIAKGENDIIIATTSKTYMERYHPNLTKISFEHEEDAGKGAGEKFAEGASDYIIYEKNSKTPLIDQLLNIQPGKIIILEYRDLPEKNAEKLKLPGYKTDVWGTVIERRDNLVAVGTLAGAAVNSRLYLQKGQDLIPIRPIPHQKILKQSGEYTNTAEYEKWVERMKKEAPEYLPVWETGKTAVATVSHQPEQWQKYLDEQKAEPKKLDLSGSVTRKRYQGIVTPVIEHLSIDDVLNRVDINYTPDEYPQEQAYIDNRLIPHMKTTKLSLPVIEIYVWDQVDNQRPMLPSGKRPFTDIHILDGAHRIVALKKIGIKHIPFIVYREPAIEFKSDDLQRIYDQGKEDVVNKLTIPPITKSLEYNVRLENNKIIKEPKKGFEFKVKSDYLRLKALGDLAPYTEYDEINNRLIQEPIIGRFATDQEVITITNKIKSKGFMPRGLLPQDIIVTPSGEYKVVDVGNFELEVIINRVSENKYLVEEPTDIDDPDVWVKSKGASFHDEVRGAHHGQVDGTLSANTKSETIGYIDYSIFEGKLYLDGIEVDPAHRRQGYATALLMKLKQLNPGKVVMWGMMTEEGCALKCAADKLMDRGETKSIDVFLAAYHHTGDIPAERQEQDLFGDEKEDCKDWDFGTYESLLSGIESWEELDEMLDCVMSSEKLTDTEIETLRKLIEKKMGE